MSFSWTFEHVKDWSKVCYESKDEDGKKVYRLRQEADALRWICMGVGINRITEKNIKKFCLRLGMLEEVEGYFVYKINKNGEHENALTESVIRKHIGLSTNAHEVTDAKFDRAVVRKLKNRVRTANKRKLVGFKSDLSVEKFETVN